MIISDAARVFIYEIVNLIRVGSLAHSINCCMLERIMKFNLVCLIVVLVLFDCVKCARILGVFPLPGISHHILSSKLMKGLAAAGHDVTMISPFEVKDVPKNGSFTVIFLDGLAEEFQKGLVDFDLYEEKGQLSMMTKMTTFFMDNLNSTFRHPKIKKLLQSKQKFDAVIMENFFNDALKVFSYIFDCPLILLSSVGPNSWINVVVGNPQPVSYAPHVFLGDFSKDLSFVNRAKSLFYTIVDYLVINFSIWPKHDEFMHHFFPNSPPLEDLITNTSLVLLNSHTSLYPALPIVPNMVEIGGYFIDPPKPLPQDLQQFLDNAKEGVIYFSMGSNLKSKDMSQERKQIFLNVLGKLKEKVLWKFEEDLPGRPSNIIIRKWLPQQDILAHPNVKLFISHGGLLSTTETVYHGVPIFAIPVFADQNSNADRAVSNGYGVKLKYNDPEFTEEKFSNLLNEALHNPQYKENIQRRSRIYHDRPMHPMKTAVYWIEYVIRHKGAPHLRVAGIKLPWYKYYLIDVLGSITLGILLILFTLRILLRKLLSSISGKNSTKQKVN